MLGMRLAVVHNMRFYNKLMEDIRENLANGTFKKFKNDHIEIYSTRI